MADCSTTSSEDALDAPLDSIRASSADAAALLAACPPLRRRRYATSTEAYRGAFEDGGAGLLPLFPPPLVDMADGRKPLAPSCAAPFLCTSAGSLPRGVPDDVDDLLGAYLVSGVSRAAPNIDVNFESVECGSNGAARRALASASADAKPYWAACHVPVEHPRWWPADRGAVAVPGFEHLIAGEGAAGIGMHRDRYRQDGRPDRLVSTYLSLGRGRKHVVLLPPTDEGAALADELGGAGCDSAYGRASSQRVPFPTRPPPALLERVLAAGGYWFDLEAAARRREGDGGAGGGAGSSPRESGSEPEGRGAAADDGSGEEEAEAEEGDDEEDEDEEGEGEGGGEEEEGALCLFMPAGWWHWLLADSAWHVAWSGSFFPAAAGASRDSGRGRGRGGGGGGGRGGGERGGGRGGGHGGGGRRGETAKGKPQRGSRAPRWSRAL